MKTSNVQLRKLSRASHLIFIIQWRKSTRRVLVVALSIFLLPAARAADFPELAEAMKPLMAGVPEVTVARLQTLLKNNRSDDEWRATAEKLAEAFLAARQPADALALLDDARLRNVSSTKFWRAQALASLHRWAEALPLYQEVAADESSPFRGDAVFGAGEMLRTLERREEALQKFLVLFRDKQWGTQARLRSAELYIDKGDAVKARRVLDETAAEISGREKGAAFFAWPAGGDLTTAGESNRHVSSASEKI